MPDHLPKKTIGDVAHAAVDAVASLVPGGSQLFNLVISTPLSKRRDAWLNRLYERLVALEAAGFLRIEDLQHNDEFISTVMQASQVAIRNHQQEKLDALRNAVVNTALGQSPDDAKREMFLAFIDTFTVWHMKALAFLRNPDGWIGLHGLGVQENLILGSAEAALYTVFPELYREPDFRLTLIQDLRSRSLIKPDDSGFEFATADGGKGMDVTTRLGREFIDFISDPEKTNG